ncbi:MAG: gamma-glutamylcyclotransferase [Reyranella sp.]
MRWYFAYGSNMDAERLFGRMKSKGATWGDRIGGRLDGWRLTFDKIDTRRAGSGFGNIVMAKDSVVHGTLNALPGRGFDALDGYEGVADRHYERRAVPVVRADSGETVEAITYVALKTGTGLKPTRAYLAHLLAGRDLLPTNYWERLRATPTAD